MIRATLQLRTSAMLRLKWHLHNKLQRSAKTSIVPRRLVNNHRSALHLQASCCLSCPGAAPLLWGKGPPVELSPACPLAPAEASRRALHGCPSHQPDHGRSVQPRGHVSLPLPGGSQGRGDGVTDLRPISSGSHCPDFRISEGEKNFLSSGCTAWSAFISRVETLRLCVFRWQHPSALEQPFSFVHPLWWTQTPAGGIGGQQGRPGEPRPLRAALHGTGLGALCDHTGVRGQARRGAREHRQDETLCAGEPAAKCRAGTHGWKWNAPLSQKPGMITQPA